MAEMTVYEVLQFVIDELDLGYAEGPINTPDGGGLAIVYSTQLVDLTPLKGKTPGWEISQSLSSNLPRFLRLQATPKRQRGRILRKNPRPGDTIAIGLPSWLHYTPTVIRIDEDYLWVRIDAPRSTPPWTFHRVKRTTPLVVVTPAKQSDIDPILEKHIFWARLSANLREFKAKFDA